MIPYSEFRPTGFDNHIEVEDQEDWLVAPVSRNRDNEDDPTVWSNWKVVTDELEKLDPEEEYYQIHSFNHWGPGWFEIILVNPESQDIVDFLEEVENALSDYPLLNESLCSEKEWENVQNDWQWNGCSEFNRSIERYALDNAPDDEYISIGGIFETDLYRLFETVNDLDYDDTWELFELLGGEWEYLNEGTSFKYPEINEPTINKIKDFLRPKDPNVVQLELEV